MTYTVFFNNCPLQYHSTKILFAIFVGKPFIETFVFPTTYYLCINHIFYYSH